MERNDKGQFVEGFGNQHTGKTHCEFGHELVGDNMLLRQRFTGPERICRTCNNQRAKQWRLENLVDVRENDRKRGRERIRRLREEVLDAYGRKCACCGEVEEVFLVLDHIHGGGTQHRKELNNGHWLSVVKRERFPKDKYQLLCKNCDWAKYRMGYCPHQLQRLDWIDAA